MSTPAGEVTSGPAGEVDDDGRADGAGGAGAPRWLPAVSLVVVVLGLGVSAYLTYAHFHDPTALACPGTSVVNCEKVTTSPESHLVGIPVAVLGLVFFFVMGLLSVPAAWAATSPVVRYGRLAFAVTGIGMVVYLVYTELFTLDAICLWCTAVHLLTLVLFAVVVLGTVLTLPEPV